MIKKDPVNEKNIKKLLVIFLVLLFLIFGIKFIYGIVDPRGFFGIGLPATMNIYISETGHFSILYPETWKTSDLPQGNHGDTNIVATILPFRGLPKVNIADKLFEGGNIDQVVSWGQSRIDILPSYKPYETRAFITSNLNGMSRTYQWQEEFPFSQKLTIQCIDYYTLVEDTGYIIQFCAKQSQWQDVESVFQQMIESFQVK